MCYPYLTNLYLSSGGQRSLPRFFHICVVFKYCWTCSSPKYSLNISHWILSNQQSSDHVLFTLFCRRAHVLFTLFLFFAHSGVVILFRLVYPMFPVSLDCSFLIAPSVFSNVKTIGYLSSN
jgi:hypothetical protein